MDAFMMQLPLYCVQSDLAVNLGASGEESGVTVEKLVLNCALQMECFFEMAYMYFEGGGQGQDQYECLLEHHLAWVSYEE